MNLFVEKLRDISQEIEVDKGYQLLFEGEEPKGFYFLLKGKVRLYNYNLNGKETEIGQFGPGKIVGAALAFSDKKFPHFAEATEKSKLLFFPRKTAWKRIIEDPELASYMIKFLAQKCRTMNARIQSLQIMSFKERLVKFLKNQALDESSNKFQLKSTKKDLARSLGATAETLSRTLVELQEEGFIKVDKRWVEILK